MARLLGRSCGTLLGLYIVAGAGAGWCAPAVEERIPLAFDETQLRGGLATIEAPIHLPPASSIMGARLVLGYANALAVEPEGSSLRVALNGVELAELPLVAAQGALAAEIDIPPRAIRPGLNLLTVTGRQKHRLACTRDAFEELWTRIESDTSHFELRYARPSGAPVLRDLDALLASSSYDGEPVTIATARSPDDSTALQWGGLAAEAMALRRGARTITIEHAMLDGAGAAWQRLTGRNAVALGTLDELGALLPSPLPADAAYGLIAVRRLPGDPAHLAVVVSGATEAAVTRAAEYLRAPRSSWPASASFALAPGPPAEGAPARSDGALGAGVVTLAELGYQTRDLPAGYTETIDLPFQLPDDYYAGDGQKVELSLDFAYGAGLAPTSALIIRVNGAPWNMLRLDHPAGDIVERAEIELPMGLFRPGPNVIGFEPVLHLEATQDCALFDDQPMFSLFDDSRIQVPEFARLARQPSLALFAATAFPYGNTLDQARLLVGGSDPATVAAAWTLRAKLAQRRGAPLVGLSSSFETGPSDQHLLVVAPKSALPDELTTALPLQLDPAPPSPVGGTAIAATAEGGAPSPGTTAAVAHAAGAGMTPSKREHWSHRLRLGRTAGDDDLLSVMTGWIVRMARAVPVEPPAATPSFEDLTAFGQNGSTGALVALRSPFADDRTVTVVTAADPAGLRTAIDAMVEPAVWDRLSGDVALVEPASRSVLSYSVAAPYVIAAVDTSPGHLLLLWRTFMARHQGPWLLLVLAAIAALSLVTGLTLRRMAR